MTLYFDKEGKPMTLMEWAALLVDDEFRRVARTELLNGYTISTVWVGMNANNHPDGPLQTFETAIMKAGEFLDMYGRSGNLQEAEAMHREAVAWIRGGDDQ